MNDSKVNHPAVMELIKRLSKDHGVTVADLRYVVRAGMRAARFELNMAEIEELALFHINAEKPTQRKVGEYRNRLIRQADRNRAKYSRSRDYDERSKDMA